MKTFKFPECRNDKEFWGPIQKFFLGIEQKEDEEPIDEATFYFCVEDELGVFLNPHRQSYTFNDIEINFACERAKVALFG